MRESVQLTVASLVSIVLMTFHLTDDAFHTREGVYLPGAVAILLVWLYGTLVLAGRRSGYVVMLIGGLFGAVAPYLHVIRTGGLLIRDSIASVGSYFFVWTLLALSTSSAFAFALAVRGLWRLRRRPDSDQLDPAHADAETAVGDRALDDQGRAGAQP
jgi:hypothetical protein